MHLICSSVHFLEHIGGVQIFIHIFINAEVACVLRQPGAVNGHALKSQPSDCITLHCNAITMQRLQQCMQQLPAKVLTVRGEIR